MTWVLAFSIQLETASLQLERAREQGGNKHGRLEAFLHCCLQRRSPVNPSRAGMPLSDRSHLLEPGQAARQPGHSGGRPCSCGDRPGLRPLRLEGHHLRTLQVSEISLRTCGCSFSERKSSACPQASHLFVSVCNIRVLEAFAAPLS